MEFLVVVRIKLSMPFDHWKERFDSHSEARRAAGIVDVFAHPVLGSHAALYAVRTPTPRAVHDMIYDPPIRSLIEESGFIVGSEEIIICELPPHGGA